MTLLFVVVGLAACAGAPSGTAGGAPTDGEVADVADPATDSPDGGDAEGPASAEGTVTFRSWSPIEQTTRQMIDAFVAENPGVAIDATVFNYPEYLVDLQTRASSSTMPDIVGLQPGALTQQYREHLMPLQDCATQTWGDDWQEQFFPIGIEQARLGNPEGDDNLYALPLLVQTVNLWATIPNLEQAGVDVPTTWDEMTQAVAAMEGSDFAPFMLPAQDGWLRRVVFLQIANNVSPGTVYEAERGEASWTDPAIIEAFSWWERLFTDGIAQSGAIGLAAYPNAVNQIEAGQAGIFPLGAWWMQQSDPTKEEIPELSQGMQGFEPFLFPTLPDGAAEPELVGGIDVALGVSKDSENPELACQVVTDFIAGEAAQQLINTFNDLPAVEGLDPEEFTSDHQRELWERFTEEWMPQVEWSRELADPEVSVALEDALAAIATGEQTPEEAAQAVQDIQDAG